jgi:hypothetical protein
VRAKLVPRVLEVHDPTEEERYLTGGLYPALQMISMRAEVNRGKGQDESAAFGRI